MAALCNGLNIEEVDSSRDDFVGTTWQSIWGIIRPVFEEGNTYAISQTISEDDGRKYWVDTATRTYVAILGGEIVGSFYVRPNFGGGAKDICNCGFIVKTDFRGRKIAQHMAQYSIKVAPTLGFRAMQFNAVVEANAAAVHLWKKLGFAVVGKIPLGFQLSNGVRSNLLIWHKFLSPEKITKSLKKKALRAAGQKSARDIVALAGTVAVDIHDFMRLVGPQGESLLHRAASKNNAAVVEYLLSNDFVNPNSRNDMMKTAVHEAATYGALEALNVLLAYGADPNACRTFSWTPLMYAASRNHASVVSSLVDAGANVEACNKEGMTALYVAAREGALECLLLLIERSANVNVLTDTKRTPLFCSIMNDHAEIVARLIDSGADINAKDSSSRSIWHEIAACNAVECYRKLRETKQVALEPYYWESSDVLGRYPLHAAAAEGHADVLNLFLGSPFAKETKRIDATDASNNTALMLACSRGHIASAAALLEAGCNVNEYKGQKGRTPLHLAVGFKRKGVVKLLLKHGAKTGIKDDAGNSPLEVAMKYQIETSASATNSTVEADILALLVA